MPSGVGVAAMRPRIERAVPGSTPAPGTGAPPPPVASSVGAEGDGATRTVAVTPGTWRLYCSLNGHEAMTRDLAVEG